MIASNTKGLTDSVVDGKTGILFPVGDEKILAKEMNRLTEEEGFRKQLEESAFEWSKNFYWNDSTGKFLNLVKQEVVKKAEKKEYKRRFATALRSLL